MPDFVFEESFVDTVLNFDVQQSRDQASRIGRVISAGCICVPTPIERVQLRKEKGRLD